jgi:hypothetical protein
MQGRAGSREKRDGVFLNCCRADLWLEMAVRECDYCVPFLWLVRGTCLARRQPLFRWTSGAAMVLLSADQFCTNFS